MNVKFAVDGVNLTLTILENLNSERFTPSVNLNRSLNGLVRDSNALRHQLGHMMNLGLLEKTGGTVDAAYRSTPLGEKYREAVKELGIVGAAC